jgi:RHH-type transcriptional regulator, proline utilization regulon repressor / proline dehydrogenase / delta 1-pyrroline-5-carboxylate dehydrogenase
MTSRDAIHAAFIGGETTLIEGLTVRARLDETSRAEIARDAQALVSTLRLRDAPTLMEAFLAEYGLSSREGVALLCLAETLLRVPDDASIDDLIAEKLSEADWRSHAGRASSLLVNASTWALMLTGRVIGDSAGHGIGATLHDLVRRMGEPLVRIAVRQAMREMGHQFVLGEDIESALEHASAWEARGYTFSYDMLGEAARTEEDARRYHLAYADSITALARRSPGDVHSNPGISVKLSALHPRYEALQRSKLADTLIPRVQSLALLAANAGIGFNIDAEEVDRLDLSLDVIEALMDAPSLTGWDGLGVVVQAYQKRALPLIDWLATQAARNRRRMMVRLVKGAYWDTEIKRAQSLGLEDYPVFTRKPATDVSWIACARTLFEHSDLIYSQFATHNAHSATVIRHLAGRHALKRYEFQRLHGMGEALHDLLRMQHGESVRIYAPVGVHTDLLAYLVRRLLENGANSSFVHQLLDERLDPSIVARDPFSALDQPIARLPAPREIFPLRRSALGYDPGHPPHLVAVLAARGSFLHLKRVQPAPMTTAALDEAVTRAVLARPAWEALGAQRRAALVAQAADNLEADCGEALALLTREGGKVLADSLAEIRETIDLMRFYALGAVGQHEAAARGVIACIAPWNFPLAIFTGQVVAALVTGNAVIAKPAEQTPLLGALATRLLHDAGIPPDVLVLAQGDGEHIGNRLTAHPAIDGVVFTGSLATASRIHHNMATHGNAAAPLIAETGGINAMLVDSTALLEAAVRDIVVSAFTSAGQRCSALRIVYVQEEIAGRLLTMLRGAMDCLQAGDPAELTTDTGPLIDADAQREIQSYLSQSAIIHQAPPATVPGSYIPATLVRCHGIEHLAEEIFGPVLHWATFRVEELDRVIDTINGSGYGLTFALHTRLDDRVRDLVDRLRVGNIYVNRNQIGAVVESQPFGGEGLSGTGPKAGGPHYLARMGIPPGVKPRRRNATPRAVMDDGALRLIVSRFEGQNWRSRMDRLAVLQAVCPDLTWLDRLASIAPRRTMAGVTGEENTLRLEGRAWALCLGPDPSDALAQAVQALWAGAPAVVCCLPSVTMTRQVARLRKHGAPIHCSQDWPTLEAISSLPTLSVLACATDRETVRPLRIALAGRPGAITRFSGEVFDPLAYVHERHVCVDTTAAGGNTTLLLSST